MLRILTAFVILFASISKAPSARATALRYALVIGNNVGVDGNGAQPFLPLRLAEKEAAVLKDKLVRLSNFDKSGERTKLLVGATRYDVSSAINAIAKQMKTDRVLFGKTESLFLFYFTGHGMEGELLLEDGPLTANELGEMIRSVDADFSIGVFDACYSGSLQKEALNAKGLKPTPGLNLFAELPEEVLSAEGSIWYVSSGQGQASYEDEQIGGVFTHFFTEALDAAPLDGPGITLDRVWGYARQHTVEYTAHRQREQAPEQFIAKLKAGAPIYFSFPLKRDATLVLSESVQGQFALSYADGHLTEIVHKTAGQKQKLAVYPGRARLALIEGGHNRTIQEFRLQANEEVVLRQLPQEAPVPFIGERSVDLWEKGIGAEHPITASAVKSGLSVLGGPSYGFTLSPREMLLPEHTALFKLRLDVARFAAGIDVGYGYEKENFSAWGYSAHCFFGTLTLGAGVDIFASRLTFSASFRVERIWQRYENDMQRDGVALMPAVQVGWAIPTNRRLVAELFLHFGPTRSLGAGVEDSYRWYLTGGVGLAGYYRFR